MSLVKNAETKNLPLHQFMDVETLDYIKKNNPFVGEKVIYISIDVVKEALSQTIKYLPSPDWFYNSHRINTLHGMRHLIRVMLYSAILYIYNRQRFKYPIYLSLIAAALHDIRRKNDKADEGHAVRANKWFKKNYLTVNDFYKLNFSELEIEALAKTILLHEIPYTDLNLDLLSDEELNMVDTLKTADALDRYVQPKVKWWIKDSYLKLLPSLELKRFAYNLVIKSEAFYLKGENNLTSIIKSLK